MKISVAINGLYSVRKFIRIDDRFDRLAAFRRAGRVVANNAKDRAPWRTGHLSRNISYEADEDRAEIGVSLDIVPYAWYQEAGTSKMPAHPYLRPGLEASTNQIDAIFRDELQKAVHARATGGKTE